MSHERESLPLPQKEEPAVLENFKSSALLSTIFEDLRKLTEEVVGNEVRALIEDHWDLQKPHLKLSYYNCLTKI